MKINMIAIMAKILRISWYQQSELEYVVNDEEDEEDARRFQTIMQDPACDSRAKIQNDQECKLQEKTSFPLQTRQK